MKIKKKRVVLELVYRGKQGRHTSEYCYRGLLHMRHTRADLIRRAFVVSATADLVQTVVAIAWFTFEVWVLAHGHGGVAGASTRNIRRLGRAVSHLLSFEHLNASSLMS